MTGHKKPARAKAGTMEDFEEYRRGGGGGGKGDGDGPRSLWQVFNDKISDMTQEFRTKAREVIRKEQIMLDKQFSAVAGHPEYHATLKKLETDLSRTRQKIAAGGVKGAVTAAVVLWNASKPQPQGPSV